MMIKYNNKEGLIIFTGSPATGKNTILEGFLNLCDLNKIRINRLITDTTRPQRVGEINGIDYNFINLKQYKENFYNGIYFGDDWSNSYNGNYYGTPKTWTQKEGLSVGIPTCVSIAKEIIENLGKKNVVWIHLVLEQQEKIRRLLERNISQEELNVRINRGDTHNIEELATLNINTGLLKIDETIREVSNNIFKILK